MTIVPRQLTWHRPATRDPLTLPSPQVGERVAQGWRGEAEPYPELGEGERPSGVASIPCWRMAMISVEEALARLMAPLAAVPPEQVSVADAVGRVLAEDVASRRTQP